MAFAFELECFLIKLNKVLTIILKLFSVIAIFFLLRLIDKVNKVERPKTNITQPISEIYDPFTQQKCLTIIPFPDNVKAEFCKASPDPVLFTNFQHG